MGAEVRLTDYGDVLTHDNGDGTQTRIVTVYGAGGVEAAMADLSIDDTDRPSPEEVTPSLIQEVKRMPAPIRGARLAVAAVKGAFGEIIDRKDK